jgi:ABC-type sulfate/molybdate transport systems ATPase subunit
MQQRVAVARALVHDPAVVLLDEPFGGLDTAAAATLCRMLRERVHGGRAVVLVTHRLATGLAVADRWIWLSRGRVRGAGRGQDTSVADLERIGAAAAATA